MTMSESFGNGANATNEGDEIPMDDMQDNDADNSSKKKTWPKFPASKLNNGFGFQRFH